MQQLHMHEYAKWTEESSPQLDTAFNDVLVCVKFPGISLLGYITLLSWNLSVPTQGTAYVCYRVTLPAALLVPYMFWSSLLLFCFALL